MAVNTNDVIEVSARCEFGGVEDVINVYQFRMTTAGPVDDDDVMLDLGLWLEDVYQPVITSQTNDFAYRDIAFRNVTQSTVMGTIAWPTYTAGAAAPNNIPPGLAALINFATNKARVILKKYIGGWILSGLEADGTFTGGLVALMLSLGIRLLSGWVGAYGTYEYGYLSPKTLSWEVPVGYTVTDVPAYQRRRKQGRGA